MSGAPILNEPRQQRSRDTLTRLQDATEELLQERPIEDIAVSDIVRHARSSVGSFYTRFSGKEALVVALLERYHQDVQRELARLANVSDWHRMSLSERGQLYVARVIEHCRRRRGLLRLRLQRRLAASSDPAMAAEPQRNRQMVVAIEDLFLSCRNEIGRPDPDRSLAFALRTVDAVAMATIGLDDVNASFGMIDDTQLVSELADLFLSYLRA